MASRESVMETLRAQNARFGHDIGLAATIAVTDGVPSEPAEGGSDAAQVSCEMSSDTFLSIARKELTGMQAYSRKLVKVKASMGDLLKLQKLDAL